MESGRKIWYKKIEHSDSQEVINMKVHPRIELRPDVMFGKPVIKNTRITVEHILRKLAGGMTFDEIISDHPNLTQKDIFAAQEFAADYLADEQIAFA
jgi:uncharacterized protein (DUF433 family)